MKESSKSNDRLMKTIKSVLQQWCVDRCNLTPDEAKHRVEQVTK